MQNYSTSNGYTNSTAFPCSPDSLFEPPFWAIRVNELWFASLVCSLATASLGMLVKQWLREYLAIERVSPQERLRARLYRNPAMVQWKVFEIAAILPLLLQVSLGLFFVGHVLVDGEQNVDILLALLENFVLLLRMPAQFAIRRTR